MDDKNEVTGESWCFISLATRLFVQKLVEWSVMRKAFPCHDIIMDLQGIPHDIMTISNCSPTVRSELSIVIQSIYHFFLSYPALNDACAFLKLRMNTVSCSDTLKLISP